MNIGENLRFFRKKQQLSQKELAEKIHVSERTIGHYETNTRIPTLDMLETLGKALKVSVSDFVRPISKEEYFSVGSEQLLYVPQEDFLNFSLVPLKEANIDPFGQFVETFVAQKFVYFSTKEVVSILSNDTPINLDQSILIYEEKEVPIIYLQKNAKSCEYYLLLRREDEYIAVSVDECCAVVEYFEMFPRKSPVREAIEPIKSALNFIPLHLTIDAAIVESKELNALASDIKELVRLIDEEFSLSLIGFKTEEVLNHVKAFLASDELTRYQKEIVHRKKSENDEFSKPFNFNELSKALLDLYGVLMLSKQ